MRYTEIDNPFTLTVGETINAIQAELGNYTAPTDVRAQDIAMLGLMVARLTDIVTLLVMKSDLTNDSLYDSFK